MERIRSETIHFCAFFIHARGEFVSGFVQSFCFRFNGVVLNTRQISLIYVCSGEITEFCMTEVWVILFQIIKPFSWTLSFETFHYQCCLFHHDFSNLKHYSFILLSKTTVSFIYFTTFCFACNWAHVFFSSIFTFLYTSSLIVNYSRLKPVSNDSNYLLLSRRHQLLRVTIFASKVSILSLRHHF